MDCPSVALRRLLFAAGIALAFPLAAQAQPVPDYFDGYFGTQVPGHGPGPVGRMPHGRGAEGEHQAYLVLTDVQRLQLEMIPHPGERP